MVKGKEVGRRCRASPRRSCMHPFPDARKAEGPGVWVGCRLWRADRGECRQRKGRPAGGCQQAKRGPPPALQAHGSGKGGGGIGEEHYPEARDDQIKPHVVAPGCGIGIYEIGLAEQFFGALPAARSARVRRYRHPSRPCIPGRASAVRTWFHRCRSRYQECPHQLGAASDSSAAVTGVSARSMRSCIFTQVSPTLPFPILAQHSTSSALMASVGKGRSTGAVKGVNNLAWPGNSAANRRASERVG